MLSRMICSAQLCSLFIGTMAALVLSSCGGSDEPPPSYSVGGTVTGLTGSGLVLEAGSSNSVSISSDGGFTFPTSFPNRAAYSVSVTAQPTSPSQTCRVAPATSAGTINQSDVSSVTVSCGSNPARFIYIVNGGSNSVSGFSVDGATGSLTAMSGSPYATGTGPTAITINPHGTFAYISNAQTNNISAFAIAAADGVLSPLAGSPFAIGPFDPSQVGLPVAFALDPSGIFAFVTNASAPFTAGSVAQQGNFSAFNVDTSSGALSPVAGSPFTTGGIFPHSVRVAPSGKYVYVLHQEWSSGAEAPGFSAFAIDAVNDTVTLVAGSPFGAFGAHGEPSSFIIDPSGSALFGPDIGNNDIEGSSIDPLTGGLGPVIGSTNPVDVIATDPAGNFLYATDPVDAKVFWYRINSDATLTSLGSAIFSTISKGQTLLYDQPTTLVIDSTDKFAFATNTNGVYAYTIGADGGLTVVAGSPFAESDAISALTIDPATDYLYASSSTKNTLSDFYIDPISGVLTEVAGSPVSVGTTPGAIAVLQ